MNLTSLFFPQVDLWDYSLRTGDASSEECLLWQYYKCVSGQFLGAAGQWLSSRTTGDKPHVKEEEQLSLLAWEKQKLVIFEGSELLPVSTKHTLRVTMHSNMCPNSKIGCLFECERRVYWQKNYFSNWGTLVLLWTVLFDTEDDQTSRAVAGKVVQERLRNMSIWRRDKYVWQRKQLKLFLGIRGKKT